MTAFINENKGDFTDWMNARKEEFEAWRDAQNRFHFMVRINQRYFKTVDPGGTMLAELMDARVDIKECAIIQFLNVYWLIWIICIRN